MSSIYRLQQHRNWVPLTLFGLIVGSGLFVLKFTALQYLLILMFAASVSVMSRQQLITREEYLRQINELNRLAYHDELTGLFNRRKIINVLKTARKQNTPGHVLLMDLDGFKSVNDKHGHHAGDEIIKQSAMRLKSLLKSCKVARLGGDEFLIISTAHNDITAVIKNIKRSISEPYMVEGNIISIGASIGSAEFHDESISVGDLLRQADKAMYLDKTNGKSKVHGVRNSHVNQTKPAQLKKKSHHRAEGARLMAV